MQYKIYSILRTSWLVCTFFALLLSLKNHLCMLSCKKRGLMAQWDHFLVTKHQPHFVSPNLFLPWAERGWEMVKGGATLWVHSSEVNNRVEWCSLLNASPGRDCLCTSTQLTALIISSLAFFSSFLLDHWTYVDPCFFRPLYLLSSLL